MAEQKCKNCGQLYDTERNPTSFGFGTTTSGYACSYHSAEPEKTDHATGARDGYVDVWRFPCCGKLQMGGEFDGKSLPPPRSPGCETGPHEADLSWTRTPEARRYDFDVFLSFNTADETHAKRIFDFLNAHEVKVFFSRESIPQMRAADYMEAIHEALDRAHHFVVVTSSAESIRSGWVRSEWTIFLNELLSGRKRGNLLVVTTGSAKIDQLPIALRATQVVPMSDRGLAELLRFVT